jgi:[acyl-carrier-protein] S-malonyltransferase
MGAMAAILGITGDLVIAACADASRESGGVVSAANMNAPEQTVISGAAAAVELASAKCKERGAKRAIPLKVSAPFHCGLMQPAQDRLARDLQMTAFHEPKLSVVSNVDAAWVATADAARDALIRQVTGSVRWVECERQLIAADVTHFVEVGPSKVLCGLMRPLHSSRSCLNVENVASLDKTLTALENDLG